MESAKLWLRTRDVVALLGCQDCIPDSRRTLIPKTQPTEVELPLADAQQQFDPRSGDRRGLEPLESEHRTDPELHASVVLLNQIVQVL
jgi:hypothetical protein